MDLIHVALNVADAEESIAFYEQFGFEEEWSIGEPGRYRRARATAEPRGFLPPSPHAPAWT